MARIVDLPPELMQPILRMAVYDPDCIDAMCARLVTLSRTCRYMSSMAKRVLFETLVLFDEDACSKLLAAYATPKTKDAACKTPAPETTASGTPQSEEAAGRTLENKDSACWTPHPEEFAGGSPETDELFKLTRALLLVLPEHFTLPSTTEHLPTNLQLLCEKLHHLRAYAGPLVLLSNQHVCRPTVVAITTPIRFISDIGQYADVLSHVTHLHLYLSEDMRSRNVGSLAWLRGVTHAILDLHPRTKHDMIFEFSCLWLGMPDLRSLVIRAHETAPRHPERIPGQTLRDTLQSRFRQPGFPTRLTIWLDYNVMHVRGLTIRCRRVRLDEREWAPSPSFHLISPEPVEGLVLDPV